MAPPSPPPDGKEEHGGLSGATTESDLTAASDDGSSSRDEWLGSGALDAAEAPQLGAEAEAAAAPCRGGLDKETAAPLLASASLPYIAAWTASSISMLLYNKSLYRSGRQGFPYPMTLVLMHQMALGGLLLAVRLLAPARLRAALMPCADRRISWRDYARGVVPIALCQAVAMSMQNVALKLTSVHFVVMVSAMKPVLVCLLQAAMGLAGLSRVGLQIVGVVSLGVLVAVADEVQFEALGLAALVLAQLSEGVRIVLVQRWVSGEQELDSATLVSLTAPFCALALAPMALASEVPRMDGGLAGALGRLGAEPLAVSIALAAAVNVAGNLVIQKSDALTLVLAGILKDFIAIFVSAWLFSAPLAPMQVAGYSLAVAFINVYRLFKKDEEGFTARGLLPSLLLLGGAAAPEAPRDIESEEDECEGLLHQPPQKALRRRHLWPLVLLLVGPLALLLVGRLWPEGMADFVRLLGDSAWDDAALPIDRSMLREEGH